MRGVVRVVSVTVVVRKFPLDYPIGLTTGGNQFSRRAINSSWESIPLILYEDRIITRYQGCAEGDGATI